MTIARPKTGRRASIQERQRAQAIVDAYLRLRDTPEAAPEWQRDLRDTLLSADYLLTLLRDFARHGTFEATLDVRPFVAEVIARGCASFDDKVRAVAERLTVSERTAARLLAAK